MESLLNSVVNSLEKLFGYIRDAYVRDATKPVYTFDIVKNLGLPDYEVGLQYDVRDCLAHILEKSYPIVVHLNEMLNSRFSIPQVNRFLLIYT